MIPYKSSSESADLQIQPDILWLKDFLYKISTNLRKFCV